MQSGTSDRRTATPGEKWPAVEIRDESPAVARRRLRLALRKLREGLGLTQGQVGKGLEWSLSKVNRIENGDVAVSGTDLQALLRLYQVREQEQIDALVKHSRAARGRGWWDEPWCRPYLTPGTVELLQFEANATRMCFFHSTLIPGIAQVRSYAEAVLASPIYEFSEEERSALLEVRMRRKASVFEQPNPPDCVVILDESILSRDLGGRDVMVEQLNGLLESTQQPSIDIRILPLSPAFTAPAPPFVIVELDDLGDGLVYTENYLTDQVVDADHVVDQYRRLFDQLLERSLNSAASARLIVAKVAALLAEADRD